MVGFVDPPTGSTVIPRAAAEPMPVTTAGLERAAASIRPLETGAEPSLGISHIWYTFPAGGAGTSFILTTTASLDEDSVRDAVPPPITSMVSFFTSPACITWLRGSFWLAM